MESKNFNEELKKDEIEARLSQNGSDDGVMKLDDTQRVKVLSPGRLVVKRFIRNKLAIVGISILAFMFVFCFIGPYLYPYHQTQKFYKKDILENSSYAAAKERTVYTTHKPDAGDTVHYSVVNMVNSYIVNDMQPQNKTHMFVSDTDGNRYLIKYETENVYTLYDCNTTRIGTLAPYLLVGEYDSIGQKFNFSEGVSLGTDFVSAAEAAVKDKVSEFELGGKKYSVESAVGKKFIIKLFSDDKIQYVASPIGPDFEAAAQAATDSGMFEFNGETYTVEKIGDNAYNVDLITIGDMRYICSPYAINLHDGVSIASNEFLRDALIGLTTDGTFKYNDESYSIREENGELNIYRGEALYGLFTTFSVSRVNGSGALPIEFKNDIKAKIDSMIEQNKTVDTVVTKVEKQNPDASIALDESGNVIYADTEVTITRKGDDFAITCDRVEYLIDTYGKPFSNMTEYLHPVGTDGDGYDVLARIMYGGQVSLRVGFIVVIIEVLLGVIMGGISGYFGGWIDTLIMRLVDIFNCIPTMPILIIIGAFFDALQLPSEARLWWMMAVLGFLGWAGVARMVRGQILSLREQEFMVATEVGGLRISRRIFRHLIPNVMPQLIVHATAGLGSVILTESVLSFLGLGVKHPLASWGSMINSVSDYSSMINYTYIWVPVGLLICLTVIAFNFVGDGLRDAFDPKMKR